MLGGAGTLRHRDDQCIRQRRRAREIGIADRTPNFRASYNAENTTPRLSAEPSTMRRGTVPAPSGSTIRATPTKSASASLGIKRRDMCSKLARQTEARALRPPPETRLWVVGGVVMLLPADGNSMLPGGVWRSNPRRGSVRDRTASRSPGTAGERARMGDLATTGSPARRADGRVACADASCRRSRISIEGGTLARKSTMASPLRRAALRPEGCTGTSGVDTLRLPAESNPGRVSVRTACCTWMEMKGGRCVGTVLR